MMASMSCLDRAPPRSSASSEPTPWRRRICSIFSSFMANPYLQSNANLVVLTRFRQYLPNRYLHSAAIVVYSAPMEQRPHPLAAWLKRHKLKPYKFADQIKIPRRTLYSHLNGDVTNPTLNAMRAIEKGTDGKVSVRSQAVWFSALVLTAGVGEDVEDVIVDEASDAQ